VYTVGFLEVSNAGEPEDPYERVEMVGLILIERIEPLEAPARA
jgi:hypothetical protein